MEMDKLDWSDWRTMPSPENNRQIEGPNGPGVYQIKDFRTNEFIQFGESITCCKRMKSFFPKPFGTGNRDNENKRVYVRENWMNLKYRTIETNSKAEAVMIDRFLKSLNIHKFYT